jgi:hypothetical protein
VERYPVSRDDGSVPQTCVSRHEGAQKTDAEATVSQVGCGMDGQECISPFSRQCTEVPGHNRVRWSRSSVFCAPSYLETHVCGTEPSPRDIRGGDRGRKVSLDQGPPETPAASLVATCVWAPIPTLGLHMVKLCCAQTHGLLATQSGEGGC